MSDTETLKEKFFRECTSSIAGQDIVIKSANDLVTWFENHLKEEKEKFAKEEIQKVVKLYRSERAKSIRKGVLIKSIEEISNKYIQKNYPIKSTHQ